MRACGWPLFCFYGGFVLVWIGVARHGLAWLVWTGTCKDSLTVDHGEVCFYGGFCLIIGHIDWALS